MTPLPRKAVGPHPLVQTVNQLIDCIRERGIAQDPTYDLVRTANGTRLVTKARGNGNGSSSDEMVWL